MTAIRIDDMATFPEVREVIGNPYPAYARLRDYSPIPGYTD
jgi:hypothetical protein